MKCPGCGMEMPMSEGGEGGEEKSESLAMKQIIQIAADALAGEGEGESEGEDEGEGSETPEGMDPREQEVRATALRMKS